MWSLKARQQLNTELGYLAEWAGAVPKRARRFHAIRAALQKQIAEALPYWRLWVDEEVVRRHQDRVERLAEIAPPIAELIGRIEPLESEVQRLSDSAKGDDAELNTWLIRRCHDWRVRLGRLTVSAERGPDVSDDERKFGEIEAEMRETREAVQQLREADRVVATFGTDLRAAVLKGQLPQLRARLFAGGSSPEWLGEIKSLMQPLAGVVPRSPDPPPEVGNLAMILTELRGWSNHLHVFADEIQRFEERRMEVVAGDDPVPVRQLVAAAQTLRTRMLDIAEEVRGRKQQEVEDAMADLRQACGDQPELERQFAALRARTLTRPLFYREWLDDLGRFQQRFNALAQTHISALETRLRDLLERVGRKLEALEARPLSEEVRGESVLLRQDLHGLPDEPEVEEILLLLRRVNAMERAIDSLSVRADEDLRQIEQARAELLVRNVLLQSEVRRVSFFRLEIADLAQEIEQLSQAGVEESLEDRRQRVQTLAEQLDALQARFLERCRRYAVQELANARTMADLLRKAGMQPQDVKEPAVSGEASPGEAAFAVLGVQALLKELRARTRKVLVEMEERCRRAQDDLAGLPSDDLAPDDRQKAEQLRVAVGALERRGTPMVRLEALIALVVDCERFFGRLLQEQRTVRDLHERLRRRYREFNDEQLYPYCRELADRVSALIEGVPKDPRLWGAAHHQLLLAEGLFDRIELQARRLAADELHRAGEVLRHLRGARSQDQLLDELEACGHEALPPAALRVRVIEASQRRT